MSGPRAAIVGAGLAGSLLAVYLARRGWEVRLYERRGDPRSDGAGDGGGGRSFNLGMSERALRALREVGLLDGVQPRTVPMRGRAIHRHDGTIAFQPYGTGESQVLHSVARRDLNAALLDRATSFPGVRAEFGVRCVGLDRDRAALTLRGPDGASREQDADVVVGADGAFSTVRLHLQHGLRADYQQEFLPWGYQELTIPAAADGSARTRLEALHVWPGGVGLMVAHPNVDRSLTATLFLPFEGSPSFATLTSPEAVLALFGEHFPDAPALMPGLAAEQRRNPVGHMVSVRTSPWHHRDRVVLVGDACHAVFPFYGQGMNAAFEDCSVLDRCLAEHPRDRGAAFAAYQRLRKPHTDVLADLSKQNFVELRDRLRSPWFVARKQADLVLHRLFPSAWVPLYTLVAHTTVPYADALRRARRQDALLRLAGGSLAAAAALAAARAARRTTIAGGRAHADPSRRPVLHLGRAR